MHTCINCVRLFASIVGVPDPFGKDHGQLFNEMDLWNIRRHLWEQYLVRIEVNDKISAIGLPVQRIINDELMKAGLKKASKNVVLARLRLMLRESILNAARLIDGVHLKHLIHIALLVQQLVPSFEVVERAHVLDPVIVFAFHELQAGCLYNLRVLHFLEEQILHRNAQKSEDICAHHSKLPVKSHVIDFGRT